MVRPLTTLASLMLASSLYAQEPPMVIADHGGIPITEVINEHDDQKPRLDQAIGNASASVLDRGLLSESLYPVISQQLRVGPVGPDEANDLPAYLLSQPLFIVGYDRVSANWLQVNVDRLVETHAIGLVVNVETQAQMQRLLEITEHRLALTPMSADQMARAINLQHYPVFIDHRGVLR